MDLQPIIRIYTLLLSLFPSRYRDEFGEEMQAVFTQSLADAADIGGRTVLALILRELRDLPPLIFQEHCRERKLPAYISQRQSASMAEPVPKWALLASLALFLIPIFIITVQSILPFTATNALLAAQAVLLIFLVLASRRRSFLPWSLPWIGVISGFIGLFLTRRLTSGAGGSFLASATQSPDIQANLLLNLTGQFAAAGIQWGSMTALVFLLVIAGALHPSLRSLFSRDRDDWTQISFMVYGTFLLLVLFDSGSTRYSEGFQIAAVLALALGAWGYLRAPSRAARITCLLAAVTLAMAILGIGRFILTPVPDVAGHLEGGLSLDPRWHTVLREFATWLWTLVTLLIPYWFHRPLPAVLINLALCALWLILFRPVFPYLSVIFSRQEFRLNQVALTGVIGLLIYQVRHAGLRVHLNSPPALHPAALTMLLASSTAFILAERLVDINTLSASLFGLALYGLLGLWLDPFRWRQGLPAALLLIGTLPFGEHLQTFIGYPMRLLTAYLVRDGLAAFGVRSIGVDTILVFENGISQVDLPCSGIKSLWTGDMFLLAATWIERRRFNRRWLLAALAFAFLLFAANLGRVAALIAVGQALGWRLLAEMLHVPLGVLGFCGACLALIWMLRRFVPAQSELGVDQDDVEFHGRSRPRWLSPALFIVILSLAFLYSPRPQAAAAQTAPALVFSENLNTHAWPFSPGEMAWLSADGPLSASRWQFEYRGYRGSLLLITSDTWRAHHRPERCFEAYGLTVNQSRSLLLNGSFPIRQLTLSAGRSTHRATAVYWLQSNERVTDDYATRIWSDINPTRHTWVLVTILFDRSVDPLDADLYELYTGLRATVSRSLETGDPQ